ncbi:carbohydrate kinase family protein [Bacillus marinisedimentorum]|uniref:carbohydrate kinase family protein n=1 Tax=Bacillus marinisedimentorum TaxID=1821260 RepID=UPI0012FFC6D8|nr:carbohydrate kinase [Bacillus marinisedimentorum]
MRGIVTMGEALIEFVPQDYNEITYRKSHGGGPANVAAALGKLGAPVSFVGKIGNDLFGKEMKEALEGYGVDTTGVTMTSAAKTGITFGTFNADNKLQFNYYTNESAEQQLKDEDVSADLIDKHEILHFDSLLLMNKPSREAVKHAVTHAKEKGLLISFEANVRIGLWEQEDAARETLMTFMMEADILKMTEKDLIFLTGQETAEQGIDVLEQYDIELLVITKSEEGSILVIDGKKVEIPAYPVKEVDLTGAGDAYTAGLLYQLAGSEKDAKALSVEEAEKMCRFASEAASLTVSGEGAMASFPQKEKIEAELNK